MSHRVLQLAILVAGLGIALSDDGEASPSPSPSLDGDDDDGLPSCWNPLIGSMCVGGPVRHVLLPLLMLILASSADQQRC